MRLVLYELLGADITLNLLERIHVIDLLDRRLSRLSVRCGAEEFRLLPGVEVATFGDFRGVVQRRISLPRPYFRRAVELVREHGTVALRG
jgi:hypothetical protein